MFAAVAKGAQSSLSSPLSTNRVTRALITSVPHSLFRRIHGTYVLFQYARIEQGTSSTCSVSKKVFPHAVDRNRFKRRCRAVIGASHLPPHMLIIITAKKQASTATFQELKSDIESVVAQLCRA